MTSLSVRQTSKRKMRSRCRNSTAFYRYNRLDYIYALCIGGCQTLETEKHLILLVKPLGMNVECHGYVYLNQVACKSSWRIMQTTQSMPKHDLPEYRYDSRRVPRYLIADRPLPRSIPGHLMPRKPIRECTATITIYSTCT